MNQETPNAQTLDNMHNPDYDLFPNDDVGMEILSRLPLKSLLRFRIMNKAYREIIDSSEFRKLHVENQLCNNFNKDEDSVLLQFMGRTDRFEKISLVLLETGKSHQLYEDFLENNAVTNFFGPLLGLICLYGKESTDPIALCNPFLREIKILPPSPSPINGSHTVGFGYDDLKKDFKIVHFLHDRTLKNTIVEVYSRNENKWRVPARNPVQFIVSNPIKHVEPVSRRSAAVAYWEGIALREKPEGEQKIYLGIVSFDMRSEEFEIIRIPLLRDLRIVEIFAKEYSFMMFTSTSSQSEGLMIWEYKREWIIVGNLGPFSDYKWVYPMTIWKSNGFVLKMYNGNRMLALYDICSRQIVECFEFDQFYQVKMAEYKGSFISP